MPGMEAVVLASGFSRRLGADKVSQDICGRSVLNRVLGNILGAGIEKVVVVLRERSQARLVTENHKVSILYNENADAGIEDILDFSRGIRLWPPASIFASPGYLARMSITSSMPVGAKYSKIGGFISQRMVKTT